MVVRKKETMSHDSTTGVFIVLLLRIDVSAELPTPIQPKLRNNTGVISSERNILWTISMTLEEEKESGNLVVVEKIGCGRQLERYNDLPQKAETSTPCTKYSWGLMQFR